MTTPRDESVRVDIPDPSDETRQPSTYLAVEVDDATRAALEAWLHGHLTQIETEMAPVLSRFQQEIDQVDGVMPGADYPYAGAFRVNYPLTKRKVRELANRVKQAYLDTQPLWGLTLDDPHLFQLAVTLEKALDTAVEHELDEQDDLALACYEAVRHGSGFLVPHWLYREERVRTLESWTAWDGLTEDSLEGIRKFEARYPQWKDEQALRRLHALLNRGQDVEREVTETRVIKNHPNFQHVEARHVRVYPSVPGYEGLCSTPLYGYVTEHSRFELDAFEREGAVDAGALERLAPARREDDDADPRAEFEATTVFKGTMRYPLPGDPAPSRYHVWYAPKDQVLLRARFYPWWCAEADLIPFYARMEEPGFFKRGIAWDVVDEHTALNVLLNLYLNGIDMANAMRWKTKYRSLAHQQLLSKRWSPQQGLVWKDNENEVNPMAPTMTHLPAIVTGFELMRRNADEGSGTSSLQSGRESPTDPTAPGIKTIALLQQVQPNEKDVLRSMEPAFRAMGAWAMWMYFQGLKLGWIDELPGRTRLDPDLLPELAKQLRARTTLFDLDKQGRFNRDVNLLQLTASLIGATRPDVVLKMLRLTISQAGDQWARLVDTLDLERPPAPLAPSPGMGAGNGAPPPGMGAGPGTPPAAPSMAPAMSAVLNRLGASNGAGYAL